MAADAAPPFEEDKPVDEVQAPETGTSPQDDAPFNINDIEDETVRGEVEKYNRLLQGDYTKKTQALAEQRAQYEQAQQYIQSLKTDPATRQQLLTELANEHGYTLPEEDDDDPLAAIAARQEAIEARFAQQDQQAQEAQWVQTLEAQVERDFTEIGGLNDKQQKLIVDSAASRPLTAEGFLDVKGVYREFLEAAQDFGKAQRASKKAPQVARAGVAGQAKVDLSDPEVRQQQMLAALQAAQD